MEDLEPVDVAQCQGWRRHGGAFSLGPPSWVRCDEVPTHVVYLADNDRSPIVSVCEECLVQLRLEGVSNKATVAAVVAICEGGSLR